MQSWKRLSSYAIRNWYRQHDAKYFKVAEMEDRFWTPKSYSFEIYSQHKLEEKHDLHALESGSRQARRELHRLEMEFSKMV